MFDMGTLKRYTENQIAYDTAKEKRKATIESTLQAQKDAAATNRQEMADTTALKQEQLQQEGAAERLDAQLKAEAPYRAGLAADANARAAQQNLNNTFQKAIQPAMINNQLNALQSNTAHNDFFRTYYNAEQAKLQRQGLISGMTVNPDGSVKNPDSYFQPGGVRQLTEDVAAAQHGDVGVARVTKEPITPGLTQTDLSTLHTGKTPIPRKPGEDLNAYLLRARKEANLQNFNL